MLWTQQDAPQILRDRLRDAMSDDGTIVRASLEKGWTPKNGVRVTVAPDGPQRSAKGTDVELVRVTVRDVSHPRARELMKTIDGFFTTPGLQFLGFSIHRNRGTGLISGPDSKVGGFFASCTFAVGTTRKVKNHGT